jgi:hypothetical protein
MGFVFYLALGMAASFCVAAIRATTRANRLQVELNGYKREPIRNQPSAIESQGSATNGLGAQGFGHAGTQSTQKNKSVMGAKAYLKVLRFSGVRMVTGIMRGKGSTYETLATTPEGSKFLFDENGKLICSQPKGRELSVWSQC